MFSRFSLEKGISRSGLFDILHKLSPSETTYMKCQDLLSEKHKLFLILQFKFSVSKVIHSYICYDYWSN